jgi:lipopolysaccharide export system protein LptA
MRSSTSRNRRNSESGNHEDTKGIMRNIKKTWMHNVVLGALGVLVVQGLVWAYEVKDDREVSAQKPVHITASQLSFDRVRGLTIFKGNVRATHQDVTLTADEVRALSGNRQATVEGHVKVSDPTVPLSLSCGVLEYQDMMDLMTAHGDPLLSSLDEDGRPVTVTGRQMEMDAVKKTVRINQDVRITHEWGKGKAGKATYLAREDKFIMEDSPAILVPNGWLTGRRITSRLGGDRSVFVEGFAEGLFDPEGKPVAPPGESPAGTGSPTDPAAPRPTPGATPAPTKGLEPPKPGQWRL